MATLVFSRSVLGSAGPINEDEMSLLKLKLKNPLVLHVVSDLSTINSWHPPYRYVITLDELALFISIAIFFGEIQWIMMSFFL
jgi:hypothetical protein